MPLVLKIGFLGLLLLISYQYFQIQIFAYPDPIPFSGSYFYNPYHSLETCWQKTYFHSHAIAWGGLTNGHQPGNEVQTAYRQLGYDLPYLSDYFSVNATQDVCSDSFMPIYEHGMNIHKSHRLAIGSEKVSYFDVMLFQNQDIRQYLIKRLKQTAPIVAINHPTMRDSHPIRMLENLSGYDYLEVINSFRVATTHWDAALSAGKPVYILANDDCHDIRKAHKIGKSWTMVQSNHQHRDSILYALRLGKTYGVQRLHDSLSIEQLQTMIWRRQSDNLVKSFSVTNGTINVKFTKPISTIRAIGQNGTLLKETAKTDEFGYSFQPGDSYVRLEAQTPALAYFFNPVIRYDGKNIPSNVLTAKVRFWPTFLLRLSIIYCNLLVIALLLKPYFKAGLQTLPPSPVFTPNYP